MQAKPLGAHGPAPQRPWPPFQTARSLTSAAASAAWSCCSAYLPLWMPPRTSSWIRALPRLARWR
eukprot:14792162-Alexandrium_andersonii.AAC.1